MSLTEFNEKEYFEMIRNEGRAEGRAEGHAEGRELFTSLIRKLYADGREAEILNAVNDSSYFDQLMKEYALI